MKIEVLLNNGMKFTAEVTGYSGAEFTKMLNNPQTSHVNIGDLVMSKHAVMTVMPVYAVEEPVE